MRVYFISEFLQIRLAVQGPCMLNISCHDLRKKATSNFLN